MVLRRPDGTERVLSSGKPLALAFAPDSQRLATAGPGTLVRMWDYEGTCLAEAHVPNAARSVAYTPEGTRLLVLDAKAGIAVFDPHTLARLSGWSVEGPANSVVCAPDGDTVAVAFGSWLEAETGWVECWSIAERRKLATYSVSAPIGAARFGPDGKTLVLGGWSGLLTWRTLPEGELIAERHMQRGWWRPPPSRPTPARCLSIHPPSPNRWRCLSPLSALGEKDRG